MGEKGTRSNRKNTGERSEPSRKLGRERAAATLSPLQTTSRLTSFADFFFSPTPIFFLLFPQCGTWSQASLIRTSTTRGEREKKAGFAHDPHCRSQMIPRAKSERLGVKLLDHRLKVIITTKSYCLFTQCFFRLSLDWGISYPCSSLGIVDFWKLIWRMRLKISNQATKWRQKAMVNNETIK